MIDKAKAGKYAVAHFNINNLEWTRSILEVAQETKSSVILGVSEGAIKYMGGFNTVVSMTLALLNDLNITIPVALHLDHGQSIDSCKKALDAGFSSVMFDGSHLDFNENIKGTKEVVTYAKKKMHLLKQKQVLLVVKKMELLVVVRLLVRKIVNH